MIGIMDAALLAQGQESISVENDGSIEWRVLVSNWPHIVEAELEDGNYHFTKSQQHLVTRSDGKFGFDDAFLVPAGALHVRRLWVVESDQRVEIEWVQDGTHVHVNSPGGCYIEYISVASEHLWSANFTMGVQKKLEALILRSIKEEFSEASHVENDAEEYFQRARTHSSKARTPQKMYKKGRIASARNRRG